MDRPGHAAAGDGARCGSFRLSTHGDVAFGSDLARRLGDAAAAPPDLLARVGSSAGTRPFAGVVAPDSPDGIAEVLAACSAEQWPVVPLGAATWWRPAGAPAAGGSRGPNGGRTAGARPPILLSTVRLDRITEHVPADLVIGVQGGLPVEQLAAALAQQQQWLPLDPPAAAHATIGATVALADAGPLRAAHGTPRDMALGVEIATGDGRLLRFGGRVVKNVAGYDGVRLAVGSRGTIGVITAIFLRVRGAPRADRTLGIACGAGSDGARRGAELALAVRSAAACDALELIAPAVARHLGSSVKSEWTLLIRLLGSEAAVAEGLDRVNAAASRGVPEKPADLTAGIWQQLTRLEASAEAALRLGGPTTGLADGLALAASLIGSTGTQGTSSESKVEDGWCTAAHAADGIIRLWHPAAPPANETLRQLAAPAAGDADEILRQPAGQTSNRLWTLRYERMSPTWTPPAGTHAHPAAHEPPDAVAALTSRLRAAFDPAGILPGAEV